MDRETTAEAWDVEVYGYMPERFVAATPAKARYRAFLQFREAFGSRIRFVDFLRRGVKVTAAGTTRGGSV